MLPFNRTLCPCSVDHRRGREVGGPVRRQKTYNVIETKHINSTPHNTNHSQTPPSERQTASMITPSRQPASVAPHLSVEHAPQRHAELVEQRRAVVPAVVQHLGGGGGAKSDGDQRSDMVEHQGSGVPGLGRAMAKDS